MDHVFQFEPEFDTESSHEEDGPSHIGYAGAFFPEAKHFVVAGGKFKSVTNIHQATSGPPPNFPVIPLGHVNLLQEIGCHGRGGVVHYRHGRNSARRMYSAQIHGLKSNMAVAFYQGDNAEERWREAVSQYSKLRHPYLLQLYGTVRTADLHAVLFHDGWKLFWLTPKTL
ncbi:hypothetical protein C8R45DRAFT_1032572 [Mycena sanguinolenta]|nr:hypothetical protein C8R45DRAFT_1032572 [Mycena sanguinolenta]